MGRGKDMDIWTAPATRATQPTVSVSLPDDGDGDLDIFIPPPRVRTEQEVEARGGRAWWWLHGFDASYQDGRLRRHPRCRYGCAGMPSPVEAGISMHMATCAYWQSEDAAAVARGDDIPF